MHGFFFHIHLHAMKNIFVNTGREGDSIQGKREQKEDAEVLMSSVWRPLLLFCNAAQDEKHATLLY